MIVLREKRFGQVKKENKARKKLREVNKGRDQIKELYKYYLEDSKSSGVSPVSIGEFAKEELQSSMDDISASRVFKNGYYNKENFEKLPRIKVEDAARKYGREALSLEGGDDMLLDKSQRKLLYGNLKSYYKNRLDRFKFEKDKSLLKNEEDLLDKYYRKNTAKVDELASKKSIPVAKRLKRFFKKNINKMLK